MKSYLAPLLDVVSDRSPDELIGALLIALALSLAMTGVYGLARRKAHDPRILICALMTLVSIASMTLAVGYVASASGRGGPDGVLGFLASPPGRVMLVRRIFEAADTDGDCLLSQDEASHAAAHFVRSLDASGIGGVDEESVRDALRYHLSRPPAVAPLRLPPCDPAAAGRR